MGIACFISQKAVLACEPTPPFHVPLAGERQYYYETLGALEFFKVRNIEGWLEARVFIRTDDEITHRDAPLLKATLTLRNPRSGEIVKCVTTDDRGHFEFAEVSPGSYVLQIVQGDETRKSEKIEGNLLIELRADAELVHLPLLTLSMSDCGMIVHKKNDENSLNKRSELPNAQTN